MTMSPDRKFAFVALLFLLFLVSVGAVHGQPPHRRRSLALKKGIHRRLDILGVSASGLPAGLDDLLNGSQTSSDPGGSSSSSSSSPQPSSTDTSTTDPPSTSDPPQTSSAPSSTPDPPSTSPTPSSPPSTSDPSSPSPSSDPATSNSPVPTSPSSTPPPETSSASPSVNCPLGLDLAGNCVLPPASSPAASSPSDTPTQTPAPSTPAPTSTSSTPDSSTSAPNLPSASVPQSESPPSSQPPPSSSNPSSPSPVICLSPTVLINGVCVLPSSPSPSSPPDSATPAPSSSAQQSPPSSQQSLASSQQSPPSKTPTPSPVVCVPPAVIIDDVCVLPQSPVPGSATNGQSSFTQPAPTSQPVVTSPSAKDQSSSPSPAPSPSSPIDPCGPLGRSLGLCSTNPSSTPSSPGSSSPPQPLPTSQPPSSSSGVVSSTQPPLTVSLQTTPVESCGPDGIAQGLCSVPSSGSPSSSVSGTPASSGLSLTLPPTTSSLQNSASSNPGSISSPTSVPFTGTSGISSSGTTGSLTSSSSGPVISFPSGTTDSLSQTGSLSTTVSAGSSSSTFTASPNSQFSYVTMTSLLGASVSSSSISITQTNPDAPLTTLSLSMPSNTISGPPSAPTLPSNLPARIYPPTQVDPNSVASGYTFCSLLFTAALRWDFVAQYTESQGQIFAWTPIAIEQALGMNASFTFALQVFVPSDYQGPGDVDMLRTEYLFFLQNDQVPVLANQLKVLTSRFYQVDFPFRQISMNVDASFALTSVANPDVIPGSPSAATSRGDKSRTNTIIGVVSGLGGLALIVLGVLVFNGVKRSRELRHRRLSDPNVPNDPYPDRTGRDFDQDSIGGQRRRSFYFAEDSLRGQQAVGQSAVPQAQVPTQYVVQPGSQIQYSQRTSPESMRERRPAVGPVSISAPVLTQSSLNW